VFYCTHGDIPGGGSYLVTTRPLVASEVQYSSFNCAMLVCFTVGVFLASCGCALTQTGLSTSEKQDLLDAHNYYRSSRQPHRDRHEDDGEVDTHSELPSPLTEQDYRARLDQMQFYYGSTYTL